MSAAGLFALFTHGGLRAQYEIPFDPGVFQLDRTFHHGGLDGGHAPAVAWAGALTGSIAIASDTTLVGTIQIVDRNGNGVQNSRAVGVLGNYYFDLDGRVLFDFWPAQPGADQHWFGSDPAGTVLHHTPTRPASTPLLWIATAAASNASTAQLTGNYTVRSLRLLPQGTAWTTRDVEAVLSCDGAGTGTLVGTERTVTPNGVTSQQTLTLGVPYSIAADGTLVTIGGRGAVTEDGEMFYLVTEDAAQQEFGLWLGVKQGQSSNLHDLAGRLSVSGSAFDLLTTPGEPSTAAACGVVEMQAFGPSLGSAVISGTRLVRAGATLHEPAPLHSAAALGAVRSGPSEVTLADAELQWTLSFSANGRYWVGREHGNPASLLFGVRQTAPCEVVGPAYGNFVPGLGLRGFPQLGNDAWGLRVNHGRGGAPAVLAFAAAASAGWLLVDQVLWVDPATALATAGFVLGGAPGVLDVGSAEHAVPVPNDPGFLGLSMTVQALVFEPQRATGIAMSRALRVHIGS
jgi:hypothetical protein